jgi:hypothetical protein
VATLIEESCVVLGVARESHVPCVIGIIVLEESQMGCDGYVDGWYTSRTAVNHPLGWVARGMAREETEAAKERTRVAKAAKWCMLKLKRRGGDVLGVKDREGF